MNSQQQQQDMYPSTYDSLYSNPLMQGQPSSTPGREYTQHNLNRQTSRHFENFTSSAYPSSQMASSFQSTPRNDRMPTSFTNASRMDSGRYEGMNSSSLQSNYTMPYQSNNTWTMGSGMGNGMPSQSLMGMNMDSATLGASNRNRPQSTRRAPLPNHWMDQQQQSMPFNDRNGLGHQAYGGNDSQTYNGTSRIEPDGADEDLIPTAIVIKNIPFAVKKEQLTEIMNENNLPLPYAFNYHFDAGVFRGLAFANFTSAEETRQVIEAMNHMDIAGRKLRVEYKKMLPAKERERIEREKRERRGQLEEQHRPTGQGQPRAGLLQTQSSMSSLSQQNTGTSPSPVSFRGPRTDVDAGEFNMNDPTVLQYYTDLMVFIGDGTREVMIFPETLPPEHRLIIHTLAHKNGLEHRSRGNGEQRQVVVTKTPTDISPPLPAAPIGAIYGNNDYNRRALNRAATTDFSTHRIGSNADHEAATRQPYLDVPNSPSNGFGGRNLREAKSFADLRSHSGSPSLLTSANYPPMPNTNMARYNDMGAVGSGQAATPNLTPTSSNNALSSVNEDLSGSMDRLVLGGFGSDRSNASRSNGRLNMERDNPGTAAGAIGSHRTSNGNYEDQPRNGVSLVPERQPRLPGWDNTQSFSTRGRQNGLGSRGDVTSDQSGRYL